jgi:hypothetical protein
VPGKRPPDEIERGDELETRTVSDAVAFSEEKMQKNALFDSPHFFYDAYCLLPGQFQKVHAH